MLGRHTRAALGAALVLAASQGAVAADAEGQLREFFDEMTSVSADFRQVVLDSDDRVLSVVTGRVRLLRPKYLSWIYDEPEPLVLAADGESFWVYDPVLEQATVRPFEEALAGTPLRLLFEAGPGKELRDIEFSRHQDGLDWLVVRLPDTEAGDEWFIGLRDGAIEHLQFRDDLGQRVHLRLLDLQVNLPLDAADFAYAPPPGADVLGQEIP